MPTLRPTTGACQRPRQRSGTRSRRRSHLSHSSRYEAVQVFGCRGSPVPLLPRACGVSGAQSWRSSGLGYCSTTKFRVPPGGMLTGTPPPLVPCASQTPMTSHSALQTPGGTELVVVNPTFILGPALTAQARSSLQLTKAMLDGTMPVVRRQRFGVADVRDVADLHIRAMATPDAAGKRFLALADGPTISFLEMAQILRERLGPLAERVPTEEAPGPEPPRLIIHNDRAKRELGWRPRPAETTNVETAASLRDLGLLEKR